MLRTLIARMLSRSACTPPPAVLGPVLETVASRPVPIARALAPDEIDLAFYRLVGADPRTSVSAVTESLMLDSLLRLVKAPASAANLVPRVPAVIPPLLRSLRDATLTSADIARQISQDVVLVAEVIREANSPYYMPVTPVRNLEGAVLMLGQNGLRMLLARVAFRPVISQQSGRFARLAAPVVWSQAEKCALAASMLAPENGADPFEAYLAGLVENVGLIVAFRMIDQAFSEQTALPASAAFSHSLYTYARMIAARVAMLWELPPNVVTAIGRSGETASPLCITLEAANRISKLRMLTDAGRMHSTAATARLNPDELNCFCRLRERIPG